MTTTPHTAFRTAADGSASSTANRLTALVAGVAASAATLLMAVSPSLSTASTALRSVELPRVVITATRAPQAVRTVALPTVVIAAVREVRSVALPRVQVVAKRSIDGARIAQAGL